MSALGLLENYSSSSNDSNDSESDIKRRKLSSPPTCTRRLPLPELFNKPHEECDHLNEPDKHNGRLRSYPHERGNWSTYVFVPYCPNKGFYSFINKLLEKCSTIHQFNLIEDFHISLSRTVVLKFHWINNFIASLKESLLSVKRFSITLDTLGVYCNDEESRTFIGLKVGDDCSNELRTLVEKTDFLLEELQLKTFYKDPSFHISLLWCLGNKRAEVVEIIPSLQVILDRIILGETEYEEDSPFCLDVDTIICKTGNKNFNFELI